MVLSEILALHYDLPLYVTCILPLKHESLPYAQRCSVKAKYGIDESNYKSMLVTAFCKPCSLAQIEHELKSAKKEQESQVPSDEAPKGENKQMDNQIGPDVNCQNINSPEQVQQIKARTSNTKVSSDTL